MSATAINFILHGIFYKHATNCIHILHVDIHEIARNKISP